ncbi:MAG: hypothetical protein U0575_11245 [Phycisphaerales bacterium]
MAAIFVVALAVTSALGHARAAQVAARSAPARDATDPERGSRPDSDRRAIRFEPWDLTIDPGGAPLAAWQVEITSTARVAIVGIEAGDAPGFADPPQHDPAALGHGRIVLASFSLAPKDDLPRGPFRAATLHLQLEGPMPDDGLDVRVEAASDADGNAVPIIAAIARRAAP